MIKVWADVAWDDYCAFFDFNQKKLIKMVHELIKDIERNGVDKGRGQQPPVFLFPFLPLIKHIIHRRHYA